MKVTKTGIAKHISDAATDHDMTLEELSRKSGVGLSKLKMIVSDTTDSSGNKRLPNTDDLLRLADALKVSPYYLLMGNSDKNHVVCEELGLSDDAVNLLRSSKAKGKTEIAEMINLLSDTRFTPSKLLPTSGELLLTAIYDYIRCDGKNVYEDPSDSENGKGQYIGSLEEFYLIRIVNELKYLRESYQKTREKKMESDDYGKEVVFLSNGHVF